MVIPSSSQVTQQLGLEVGSSRLRSVARNLKRKKVGFGISLMVRSPKPP